MCCRSPPAWMRRISRSCPQGEGHYRSTRVRFLKTMKLGLICVMEWICLCPCCKSGYVPPPRTIIPSFQTLCSRVFTNVPLSVITDCYGTFRTRRLGQKAAASSETHQASPVELILSPEIDEEPWLEPYEEDNTTSDRESESRWSLFGRQQLCAKYGALM